MSVRSDILLDLLKINIYIFIYSTKPRVFLTIFYWVMTRKKNITKKIDIAVGVSTGGLRSILRPCGLRWDL
jgi:hypothetical protein